ncbi:PQQ-binding-like beta-propeller repeat protein [Pseudoalteromonas luteoviolacea]|uniref:Pyrrolo-quinoline quinone repeat domain-containing protein n=1 Tax=Pseudoalteromonas luteoviolacea NCIMB 1942 TaxID=1365253 RepID=A0A166Z357_9GAMM|nr:PQQ-binding-like beta-propeller repeat protein [Pseudoalteromonas luteoviolacea]KZN43783.1 hypothetical protein N482_18305 [Pseudoalteromonas luteoviolacea NCIMB 1942]KZX01475.1 hypothetical protein JL49_04985 [Pseudoalteromonas luteoviolacea]
MKLHQLRYLFIITLIFTVMSFKPLAKSGDYLYSFQTGSENWGSISLKGHLAYFGSDNGKLYSLDIDRAKLRWSFSTGDKARSKPLIDQYRVYFTSDDGYLYALNRWTGKPIWQTDLNDADYARVLPANHAPWGFDYTKSSPISDRTSVYVGSADGHFYAFVKRTGALRWKFKADSKIRSTASLYQGLVYVTTWGGTVYALDKMTGDVVWQHQTQGAIPSSPMIIGDVLVVGSRDTYLYGFAPLNGDMVWKKALPGGSWVESSAVAGKDDDYFYIGSSDAKLLFKMATQSGEIVWQTATPGWSWGQPVVHENRVYIGSAGHDEPGWYITERGFLTVDTESGDIVWEYQPNKIAGFVHGGVYASPAVSNTKVLVPDLDGYIHIFEK